MSIFSGKHSRQAVFIYDGHTWYGRIFVWKSRKWTCVETVSQLSANPNELPRELLNFASSNSAKRVRILLPSEIHSLQTQLPSDIEPEEIHTALSFEVADETGTEAHMVALAAVWAGRFCMGAAHDMLLAGSFGQKQLEHFEQQCKTDALVLDGVGPLELATLNSHARREPNAAMLLLRDSRGFYVSPAAENHPFMVQAAPFGVNTLDEFMSDSGRVERASRMFGSTHTHVHVWTTHSTSAECRQGLRGIFGDSVALEYIDLTDMMTDIAMHAAWQGHVGQVDCGCAMTAVHKEAKSPYRVGTWLFCIIIVMTSMFIGLRWYDLHRQMADARQRRADWALVLQERKNLKADISRLKSSQSHSVAVIRMMQQSVLPTGIADLLDTLATCMPAYTKITSIIEKDNGSFEIHGLTRYQQGLLAMNHALADVMEQHGYFIDPGLVQQTNQDDTSTREVSFVCKIVPESGLN